MLDNCQHQFSQCSQLFTVPLRDVVIVKLWAGHEFQVSKVKSVTIVKGDPKAPFSIATIPVCRGGRYSFPWIAPLYP